MKTQSLTKESNERRLIAAQQHTSLQKVEIMNVQKTVEKVRKQIDENTVAHIFVDNWETFTRWQAINHIKTALGLDKDIFDPEIEKIARSIVDDVFQCRFEMIAILADSASTVLKWLNYKGVNTGSVVQYSDIEGLRKSISEPFEIMSDIECSLADQKDDLENALDEFDFAQVEELSDQLRSIQRVLY